jgi:4-amino-4-deoxy-L-arabinose transferase-like glycosyltransferase
LAVTASSRSPGIAAVLATWWLARSVGGAVAGLVAGLAMAVSTSAVDESTFIWNPNLIALSSAVALAGAWQAWTTRDPRWWLLAGVGTAVTMQCHVLGVTMLPIVGALLVADARSRGRNAERRRVLRFGLGGLAVIVLAFVPLAVHELTTNFSEIYAALVYHPFRRRPHRSRPAGAVPGHTAPASCRGR